MKKEVTCQARIDGTTLAPCGEHERWENVNIYSRMTTRKSSNCSIPRWNKTEIREQASDDGPSGTK
jgi:hypothetical protein